MGTFRSGSEAPSLSSPLPLAPPPPHGLGWLAPTVRQAQGSLSQCSRQWAAAPRPLLGDAEDLAQDDDVRIAELVAVGGEDHLELRRVAENVSVKSESVSPAATVWSTKPV